MAEGGADPSPPRPARELHEAASVGRSHEVDRGKGVELAVGHGCGHLRQLDAEHAAEAAALPVCFPADDLGVAGPEQLDRLVPNAEHPECVTGMVVADPKPVEPGTDPVDPKDLHKELRQLPRALSESPCAHLLGVIDQSWVEAAHHAGTASRGEDHVVGVFEDVHVVPRHAPGLFGPARIMGGLAAACLPQWHFYVCPEMAEKPDRVSAGVRVELISEAGCEEGDAHAQEPDRGSMSRGVSSAGPLPVG